jgi:hypothetical protein
MGESARRRLLLVIAAALAFCASLGAAARADDVEDLRRQMEAQDDLIRQQAEALERQNRQMEEMGDRVRMLEDEQLALKRSAVSGAADPDGQTAKDHLLGTGVPVTEKPWGSFNFRFYTYLRYLNQKGLDSEYTDSFGNTSSIDRRQDIQLNKVNLYSYGWVMDPRLSYVLYVWTANPNQGQGAQVVVAGFLQYRVDDWLVLGGGINALPGTRTTMGTFPNWLGVDNRFLADEFFRPSYTTGIWAKGKLFDDEFAYHVMLANNLSTLGVDAGQLDAGLNTVSLALSWEPLGSYGPGLGDFENHEHLATRIGFHFTRSGETAQSQPNTDTFDNTQIRLSDGNVIFQSGLFGPGIQIQKANYQMAALDGGLKYQGYALEGEAYYRWVDHLRGPGTDALGFDTLQDLGFQLMGSAMVLPEKLQLYVGGSMIFGQYGDPWDVRVGANWFPFENKTLRWNNELMYLRNSPVGGLAYPYVVGGNGLVFQSNLEIAF